MMTEMIAIMKTKEDKHFLYPITILNHLFYFRSINHAFGVPQALADYECLNIP
jgi:hypothetical protein